jgi:hypothetical protein
VAQHDYVIANGTGAAVRSDLNNALAAIVSQNSGATEPATMYAYQWWADTSTGLLKLRNAANNAWITLRELDGTLTMEDGTVSAPGLAFASDLNTGIFTGGADQFNIATNGVERVEFGTSEVVFNDGGANYDFRIEGDTNSSLFFVDASAEAVGIGTTSPGARLTIVDGVDTTFTGLPTNIGLVNTGALAAGLGAGINFGATFATGITTTYAVIAGCKENATSSNAAGYLAFGTRDSGGGTSIERARIDSSGRLLVGTSSTASAGGVSAQHAFSHSTSSQWAAQIQHTTAAGNTPFGLAIRYTAATPNGGSSDFLFCEDATAIRARIYSNGGLGNYSANNVNLSDRNAKKDIRPAAGTWDCLKEWEIVNFRYKEQPDDADLNMGVIAQQVAESCPEVITVFQEATEDQPEKLGVKDQQMMWMAIKALQEAQLRIETLEAEVAALKGA